MIEGWNGALPCAAPDVACVILGVPLNFEGGLITSAACDTSDADLRRHGPRF